MTIFDEAIGDILAVEGGYVNDPADSGGETNFGITKAVARECGYNGEMMNLDIVDAKLIYKKRYWDPMRLDLICRIAPGIVKELMDTAVNMGVGRSGQFLQKALNALNRCQELYPDMEVDGKIGAGTIDALKRFKANRGTEGEKVLLRVLNGQQVAFYLDLVNKREKDEKYFYGWILNRVVSHDF